MENKKYIVILAAFLGLVSCKGNGGTYGDYIDKHIELTRDEFKEALLPEPYSRTKAKEQAQEQEEPEIPEMADILLTPSDQDESEEKLISLSITEEVPLKDVLIEISRLADIDMEIDATITGGVIFRVKDKPYMEVLERISDLGGLRYEFKDGVMRIERDAPYVKSYTVDFLNIVRSNSGGVSLSTQVLSSSVGDGGEGLSSGSTNEITSSYDGDIWTSLEAGLTDIMGYSPESLAVVIDEEGVATPVEKSKATSSFSINKQAGVITALATHKQHKSIDEYIKKVRRNATAQVLIEAKIVEVTLDEEFRTGINWGSNGTDLTDFLKASRSGAGTLLGFTDALNRSDGSIAETAQFALFRGDKTTLKAAVQMMESFGTSRTLSSPRLNALNNQQAVLTFAENKVYFTVEVSKETETNGDATEETVLADSTVNTVPIGIILTLQPSIDLDKEEITMNIRPTLSRITSFVDDPGVNLQVAQIDSSLNISSQIPVIEVRELDSMLKMGNGQIMVMGGLMEERTVNEDTGVPYASRIPVLGNLFKGTSKTTEIVETVIFIKATIVDVPIIPERDKKFYRNFTRDPRPLAF